MSKFFVMFDERAVLEPLDNIAKATVLETAHDEDEVRAISLLYAGQFYFWVEYEQSPINNLINPKGREDLSRLP